MIVAEEDRGKKAYDGGGGGANNSHIRERSTWGVWGSKLQEGMLMHSN